MMRVDQLWLAVEPVDLRAGVERLLARVVQVFGGAKAHHGYVFANASSSRVKVLLHDGFGVWCATRRLNVGGFAWPRASGGLKPMRLSQQQFDALVLGLPWQSLEELRVITRL